MSPTPSENRRTYVPPHVQQQMSKQLQKTVPKHMQQYVGAFMEQNVVNPTVGMTQGQLSGQPKTYKPVTHLPRSAHYNQFQDPSRPPTPLYPQVGQGPQPGQPLPGQTVQPEQPPTQPTQTSQSYGHYPQQTAPPAGQPYDFIMNPETPRKRRGLPGGGSLLGRIGLAGGGLVVFLILFSVVRSMLAGESLAPYYVSLAQAQQALIHLVTNAQEQEDLTTTNRNFAVTAQLSLSSSQSELVTFLGDAGQKVEAKQLALKIDPKLDKQLTTAAAATTYNSTFNEIMRTKLQNYMSTLETTYDKSTGKTGRALLNKSYEQAELLMEQLKADSTQTPATS